ncbi:MAG: hypothetical protein ACOYBF_05065 [Bilifractor porci]|jgi:hypothetical protein
MLLQIQVVMLDKTFDFRVNEKMPVSVMKRQILQELTLGEEGAFEGKSEDWTLVDADRECFPDENRSVEENHIRGGSTLLLL